MRRSGALVSAKQKQEGGIPIYRDTIKYIAFNVLSMLGFSCYILADTFFIANRLESSGLTALNLVIPVFSVISATGLLIGMGAATRYAILNGRGAQGEAKRVFTHGLALAVLAGILYTLAGVFFSEQIAALLKAEGEIFSLASVYLKTILLFSGAFLVNNLLVCFIRNDGNPGLAMTAMLAGSFSNIILDYVFLYPFKMGMFGAAFATCLAPLISLCVLSLHFIKRRNQFRLVRSPLKWGILRNIATLGAASFINEMASAVTILLFNITILRLSGNMGVAAYGIVANLVLVAASVFTGIAQGVQPVISSRFGAGHKEEAKKVFRLGAGLALACGALFYLGSLPGAKGLAALFNREGDPGLTRLAVRGIHIYFLAFLPAGINIVTSGYFSAAGRPGKSMLISFLRGFGAVVVFLLILPAAFGMDGVWFTIPCAESLTLVIAACCLAGRNKAGKGKLFG